MLSDDEIDMEFDANPDHRAFARRIEVLATERAFAPIEAQAMKQPGTPIRVWHCGDHFHIEGVGFHGEHNDSLAGALAAAIRAGGTK